MKLTRILSRLVRSTCGQDLIEYALMAGFILVAAGAILPGVANSLSHLWHKATCANHQVEKSVDGSYSCALSVSVPVRGSR